MDELVNRPVSLRATIGWASGRSSWGGEKGWLGGRCCEPIGLGEVYRRADWLAEHRGRTGGLRGGGSLTAKYHAPIGCLLSSSFQLSA